MWTATRRGGGFQAAMGVAAVLLVLSAGCADDAPPDAADGRDASVGTDAATVLRDASGGDTGVRAADAAPSCLGDDECDDGVDCTRDLCDPAGGCVYAPDDTLCDARFCSGLGATCDSETGCGGGSARDCSDGDGCTVDTCSEPDRRCVHDVIDADGDGSPDAVPDALSCALPLDCLVGDPQVHPGAAERCNGGDDDCDGLTDEGFECTGPGTASCTTRCGSMGSYECDPTTCAFTPCAAPGESCNGLDDDCDGAPDDGLACVRGSAGTCNTSCGSMGSRECSATCTWGFCFPPGEACNGLDDDCDGIPDDGFACRPGATGSCATSCATTGTRACTAACDWGACAPPAESCNGVDDDCDGARDEDFECLRYATGSCTTTCGTIGRRSCGPGCAWGACTPPTDTCNGVDDDCDGFIDNGTGCAAGYVCRGGACQTVPPSCVGYRYANRAYAVCTTDTTWSGASSTCASYGGHLVTITSAGEQSFLAGLVTGRSWIGLHRPACTWQWVTGESIGYTRWDPGQPSSACGDQDCGVLWYGSSWPWDDYWCSSTARYVCEWDS